MHFGKSHSVVSGHDQNCVIKLSPFIKSFKHPDQMSVEILYLICIVENIIPDAVVIRPEIKYLTNFIKLLPSFPGAGAILKSAVLFH